MASKRSKSHLEQKKVENKFKFNKYQSIGAPDAESDRTLDKVLLKMGN